MKNIHGKIIISLQILETHILLDIKKRRKTKLLIIFLNHIKMFVDIIMIMCAPIAYLNTLKINLRKME